MLNVLHQDLWLGLLGLLSRCQSSHRRYSDASKEDKEWG
jgi:hypothetical protein